MFLKIRLRNPCSRRLPLMTGPPISETLFLDLLDLMRPMMELNFLVVAGAQTLQLQITNYKFGWRLLNQSTPDTAAIPLMSASELRHIMHHTPNTRPSM